MPHPHHLVDVSFTLSDAADALAVEGIRSFRRVGSGFDSAALKITDDLQDFFHDVDANFLCIFGILSLEFFLF